MGEEYVKGDYIYGTFGGFYSKKDSMPFASDLQKELCESILDGTFDKEKYVVFLKELKTKVYNFELEEKHITMSKALSQHPNDYGGSVIDSKTGLPKVKKDGTIQQRSVPCHVKLAKQMLDEGKEITIGDGINYIIVSTGPQEGITLEEYRKNKRYDIEYYYERIESPIIEILLSVFPEDVYTTFGECWHYTPKQLQKLQENMQEEFESEEEGEGDEE